MGLDLDYELSPHKTRGEDRIKMKLPTPEKWFSPTFLKDSYGEACLFHLLLVVLLLISRELSTERIELKFSLKIALEPMFCKYAA